MASEDGPPARSGQEWVVIASYGNRRAAEHMLASLGHEFRRNARKRHAEAFVASGNADGSLKLTESRVLEASGFTASILHLSLSWTVGFMGLVSTLKGAKATAHAARKRGSHVGSDEQRAHEILAQAGPGAAVLLVRCKDQATCQMIAAKAAGHASYSWDGSRPAFLAGLDPGPSTTGYAPLSTSRLARRHRSSFRRCDQSQQRMRRVLSLARGRILEDASAWRLRYRA